MRVPAALRAMESITEAVFCLANRHWGDQTAPLPRTGQILYGLTTSGRSQLSYCCQVRAPLTELRGGARFLNYDCFNRRSRKLS